MLEELDKTLKKFELYPGTNSTMSLKIVEYNQPEQTFYADNNSYMTMRADSMGLGIAFKFKDNDETYNVRVVFYKKQLKSIIKTLIKMYFKIKA